MFSRFQQNVSRYPRLFCAWLILYILAAGISYSIGRLVGIAPRQLLYAAVASMFVAALLDAVLYFYVMSDCSRRNTFFAIINRFEGRQENAVIEEDFEDFEEEEEL